jgi:hypothetical protein
MSDLSNATKKHTTKSRETIPLRQFLKISYRFQHHRQCRSLTALLFRLHKNEATACHYSGFVLCRYSATIVTASQKLAKWQTWDIVQSTMFKGIVSRDRVSTVNISGITPRIAMKKITILRFATVSSLNLSADCHRQTWPHLILATWARTVFPRGCSCCANRGIGLQYTPFYIDSSSICCVIN